ncbi:MAG: hypothetical protein IJO39_12670 [Clostridia bacterium]|nr:hypothetical protein [Clostridia bacterium]
MDLEGVNTSAELLTETTEMSLWQKLMSIELTPEAQRDIILYILLMVVLCVIGKVLYDLKEERRLKKEYAIYQQIRKDEEAKER